MGYKVIKATKGKLFNLHELGSDLIIELKVSEPKAREVCRKLNLGGGFGGRTPDFFAKKYPTVLT